MAHWKHQLATAARRARDRLGFLQVRGTATRVIERTVPRPLLAGERFSMVQPHRNQSGGWTVGVEREGTPVAFLKMASSGSGGRRLRREAEMLRGLASESALEWLQPYFPRVMAAGDDRGKVYLLLSRLEGEPALRHLHGAASRDRLLTEAGALLDRVRRATGADVVLGEAELRALIDLPAAAAISLFGAAEERPAVARLEAVRKEVRGRMAGVALTTSLIHGDFWPSNLLVDPGTGSISGIVDWESAERHSLAIHDAMHLVLYTRKLVARSHLGWEVRRAMDGAPWSDTERGILGAATPPDLELRPLLLLYWLRQIAVNLDRQPDQTRRKAWRRDNVEVVLEWL
ncbi:MAG: aminoglycoside phosphotransferase family protein [Chloroflexota bacterium]|nr:aminoglycoside phosphotransferase family protein [Chloroflexota bacterium]